MRVCPAAVWYIADTPLMAYMSLFTFCRLGPNRKQRHCLNLTFPWPTSFLKSSEASRTISRTAFTLALAVHICTQNSLLPGTCIPPHLLTSVCKENLLQCQEGCNPLTSCCKIPSLLLRICSHFQVFPTCFLSTTM